MYSDDRAQAAVALDLTHLRAPALVALCLLATVAAHLYADCSYFDPQTSHCDAYIPECPSECGTEVGDPFPCCCTVNSAPTSCCQYTCREVWCTGEPWCSGGGVSASNSTYYTLAHCDDPPGLCRIWQEG